MASEVRVWLNEAAVVGPKILGMLVRSLGGGGGERVAQHRTRAQLWMLLAWFTQGIHGGTAAASKC